MAKLNLVFVGILGVLIAYATANYYSRPNRPRYPVTPAPPLPPRPPLPPKSPVRNGKVYSLGIMMFDNVEVLDFAGPFEVFALAGELHGRFKVHLLSHKKNVRAMNGLNVVMDYTFTDYNIPALDIIVLPGTNVNTTLAVLNNPIYMNWIRKVAPNQDYIISVCTGANFLCKAGLADGLDVTTHHQLFDMAEQNCPRSRLWRDRRFTDNGRILTSAGISAGIDLSLYTVKKLVGANEAMAIAERMEYDYKDYDYDKQRGPIRNVRGTIPWIKN